jgi:hypothetical protein
MIQKNLTPNLICKCGCRDFDTAFGGRNNLGRYEYRLACRRCQTVVQVKKSTYALYRYLNNHQPSASFLKLFDLG